MASVNQTRPHCVNQMGKTHSKPFAARHGNGMASVNQTRPHFVNQMGKTHSKPFAEWHGTGTAWEWHGKCESDTAALCKSNGKDILNPLRHGMAEERHGCSMGTACYV